jgi:Kef-type K+ transport system membrane component KefB
VGVPLIAAATPAAEALADLAIVLAAAKLGDEVFKRLHQPALIGEILAGLLVGPSVLGIVEPGEVLEVFAELGVVFILFWVGLETRLSDMREVGRVAGSVGALGVLIPFVSGLGFALALGEETATAVFIGAALAATSAGITAAVFDDLGLVGSRPARTVLGAAVIDDILALILVAVATGIAADGGFDPLVLLVSAGAAVAFIAFFALGGTALLRKRPQLLHEPRFSESPLLPAVILCLALAAIASQIGLAAIIGAFLAGMIVAETRDQHPIEEEVEPLYAFFPPFFFAFIGIEISLGELADPGALALLAGLTAIAIASKLAGAYPGARSLGPAEARIVAIGMVPRGEVGIIVAGIGATAGVIDDELFAAVVTMSVLTTLGAPPALRRASARARPPGAGEPDGSPGRGDSRTPS